MSQKEEKQPTLQKKKKKRRLNYNNRENLLFFLKSNIYKSKFANTYISYDKLAITFDIKTLKLF